MEVVEFVKKGYRVTSETKVLEIYEINPLTLVDNDFEIFVKDRLLDTCEIANEPTKYSILASDGLILATDLSQKEVKEFIAEM
ncbi:hypothetical protein AALT52_01420 [Ligilactobacillus faecis]|uniref:Uncharacterized protein n=1 Tax=Ligilactobacillus faecis TaxID=762833 RepID=A0ABV4DR02_9LACO